jgi:hypothetical protein
MQHERAVLDCIAGVFGNPPTHRCCCLRCLAAAAAAVALQIQEAMLTGESVPVSKNLDAVKPDVGLVSGVLLYRGGGGRYCEAP